MQGARRLAVISWNDWKKGFDAWESATAKLSEQWMKSPAVLGPSGTLLTAVMKTKASADKAAAGWWGAWGLPTKRDQERALHVLQEMRSRMLDLEEQLQQMKAKKG
jgi:hypothetical protein